MPNGKPGDHPLTDICVHKLRTFSEKADNLVCEIVSLVPEADWWSFLYCFYEQDGQLRVAGSETAIELSEFADRLQQLKLSILDLQRRYQGKELIAEVNSFLSNQRSLWVV